MSKPPFPDHPRKVTLHQLQALRPQVRSDCYGGQRPCPWVGCRYHLFLTVRKNGGIKFSHGKNVARLSQMDATCALDVAEKGPHLLRQAAQHFGVTDERLRQEEIEAMHKLHAYYRDKDLAPEGPPTRHALDFDFAGDNGNG